MLVLPVENTLLYIEPIYIQASEARMPQLKKVVVAMGNRLIYTDTYEQALSELTGTAAPVSPGKSQVSSTEAGKPPAQSGAMQDAAARLKDEIQAHLKRYKELMSQGQFGEAGKEIEALDRLARQR